MAPDPANGIITGYRIHCTPQHEQLRTFRFDSLDSLAILHVTEDREYTCTVLASTTKGYGTESQPMVARTGYYCKFTDSKFEGKVW